MQKRAIRAIYSVSRTTSTGPLFEELKILKLSNVYILNTMIFMQKKFLGILPDVMGDAFIFNSLVHDHDTRQSTQFHSPAWRLETSRRSIRVQGVKYWNFLLDKVSPLCSPNSYKFQMKRFLLSNKIHMT